MPKIIHFDLNADNLERAVKFYEDVFDWQIEKWEGPEEYWMIKTGTEDDPGITGGIAKRENPGDKVTNFINVPNVDEFADKVAAAGGKIIHPKTAIPGVGYMVTCEDTEGNPFGILEADSNAK